MKDREDDHRGHLVHGLGLAKNLTQMDWVRRQLQDLVGIDPHPGTLNLSLRDDASLSRWQRWCGMAGESIEPEDPDFCRARCYPVRIEGRFPAAVLLPESADYPTDKMELVAAVFHVLFVVKISCSLEKRHMQAEDTERA